MAEQLRRTHLPQLRPIDPRPVMQDGEPCYLLRDPLQLSDNLLVVPQVLAAALAFCDGTRDAEAICAAFALHYGRRMPRQAVDDLLEALDDALLLENERSAEAQAEALAAYRRAPSRPPACAGGSYPERAPALKRALNRYLDAANGATPARAAERGIISPHIDYQRGGHVYAQAWSAAKHIAQQADLAIIVGTDHYGGGELFTLTRQNYATPYGILPTAGPIVDGLAEAIGAEMAFAGELCHRVEHSVELPLVWLHHLRDGRAIEVVPILAGSFGRFMHNGHTPTNNPTVRSFLDAVVQLTGGRRVIFIASGDLAHVGPAFGGPPIDQSGKTLLAEEDEALISHMQAGDAEGFFRTISRIDNRNNVCGTAPIYLTLKLLEATRGNPTGYDLCPADETGTSVVSVCGVVLD